MKKYLFLTYTLIVILFSAITMGVLPSYDGIVWAGPEEDSYESVDKKRQNLGHPDWRQKLHFRTEHKLKDHYNRHGKSMGFSSAEEYERAAIKVINNPKVLHKFEKEDGDGVYFLEGPNDFVIVSTDGYIRTYFRPNNGIRYFNKQ